MKEKLKKYIKDYNSRFVMAYDIGISEITLCNFFADKKQRQGTILKIKEFLEKKERIRMDAEIKCKQLIDYIERPDYLDGGFLKDEKVCELGQCGVENYNYYCKDNPNCYYKQLIQKNNKNDNLDTPTEDNSSDFFKIKKRQKKDNK